MGTGRRRRLFGRPEREELVRLRLSGLSLDQIAARMGRAESSVRVKLAELEADDDDEPTAEDLERIEAEQRASLPDWWDDPDNDHSDGG